MHLEGPLADSSRQCGPTTSPAPDPGVGGGAAAAGRARHRPDGDAGLELDGGLAAVGRVVEAGAVAALGHTDATHVVTREALDAGATVATHLFNAMRPVHHREPGPVVALLDDLRATVEVIADGVHVHPAMVRRAVTTKGAGRVALVTDAMAADVNTAVWPIRYQCPRLWAIAGMGATVWIPCSRTPPPGRHRRPDTDPFKKEAFRRGQGQLLDAGADPDST